MRFSALCLATLLLSATLLPMPASAAATGDTPAPWRSDPKFIQALEKAHQLEAQRQFPFAIDSFRKASKIAGERDGKVLQQLFNLQMRLGSAKDAIKTANAMTSLAASPSERTDAAIALGHAQMEAAGDKHERSRLEAADASLKQALAIDSKNAVAHYLDGEVLARMGQMDAAGKEFHACLDCLSPQSASYLRAKHFAENPALSLERMAPPVQVTALDGTRFNLDAMGGRVVLLDFWATWCGPCNAELPHLAKIAREFAGQPLVILSISWDSDETKWKQFVAAHNMTWMQYRDADHELSRRFGVQSIPHYFTIDSDGVLTAELIGGNTDVEGKLKKLLARAREAQHPETQVSRAEAGN